MILPIYTDTHPVLHKKTSPITQVTPELEQLVVNMRETMHNADGVGLAAPQVGQGIALCIAEYSDPEADESFPFMALLNPRITWSSVRTNNLEEACLSIPGLAGMVTRPNRVRVKAMNLAGEIMEIDARGLMARVLQHEIDHLNGVLFTKYVPKKQLHKRPTPDYPRI